MIKALLIDDESKSRSLLRSILNLVAPEIEILGEAENMEKAQLLIQECNPDLIFLDIELGSRSAFDLLNHYPDPLFQIIFVTAHSEYAVRAFKYAAVDYLLKPVDTEELQGALTRMLKRWKIGVELNLPETAKATVAYIEFSIRDELVFVKQSDINCLEANGSYTWINFVDGTQKLYTINLGQMEKKLNTDVFIRIHRSHIVNLYNIQKVVREDKLYVIMKNGLRLEVSRRNKQDFIERLRQLKADHS